MSIRTPNFEELAAKFAITEVIHTYCRGIDRMDRALTLSCWHPGGTDDHAPLYSGSAEGFAEWLWPVHRDMVVTRHVCTNTLIELHADKAGAETYWSLVLQVTHNGALFDIIAGGRYIDNLECIAGAWAFRHRHSILDWHRVDAVERTLADFANPPLIPPNHVPSTITIGARDRSDYSYGVVGNL